MYYSTTFKHDIMTFQSKINKNDCGTITWKQNKKFSPNNAVAVIKI